MSESSEAKLPDLIRGLLDPGVYPRPVDRIDLRQTHVSYLLFAGDDVYKVKKPLDLGFLDFTTPEKRRHFCEEEVRLNRRTCSGAYLGVVPITRNHGYQVGGEPGPGRETVDWAVHMRRLPAEGMMDCLVEKDALTHEMLGRLVGVLADFHSTAETSEHIREIGGYSGLQGDWQENFDQTRAYVGRTLSRERYDRVRAYVERCLASERPLLASREDEGRVRDGHGDLRTDSVCFDPAAPEGICIFDCIEFNERFRYCDTGLDVAFLAMDLDFRGRPDLSDLFIGLYSAAAGDATLPLALDFYKCYRAWVRGKVESFLLDEPEVPAAEKEKARMRAQAYFALAETYATRTPFRDVVVVLGVTGSGKSVLAGALASRLGAAFVSSDVVRKQREGARPTTPSAGPLDQGLYAPEARAAVYDEMLRQASALLDEGRGVVLDGTYLERGLRAAVASLAEGKGRRALFVECSAPESVIRERQRLRAGQAWMASDARWEVYLAQRRRYEPPVELPPKQRMIAETTLPLQQQLAGVLARLGVER